MKKSSNTIANSYLLSELIDDEGDFIPLISPEEEFGEEDAKEIDGLPILPVRNTVLFPGMVIPITVGREKSIKLVKKIYKEDRIIGVVTQKNMKTDDPDFSDLYKIGTVAHIIKMLVLPDGNTTIIIRGKKRFEIIKPVSSEPFFRANVRTLQENFPRKNSKKVSALFSSIHETAQKILRLNPEIPKEAQVALDNIENPGFLIHFLSSNISADVADKQKLLELEDGVDRATLLLEYMLREVKMLELKQEIQTKVSTDIDQQQRDYYLRQQIKVLQDELGYETPDQEVEKLRERSMNKKWPDQVRSHFNKELDKLLRINPAAAEYPVSMNYAELMLDLPWSEFTNDNFDLKRAKKVLDKDHYGLDKVKDRIMEYLAVLKLKSDMKAPILCLYGPPGVGKTSLGKSIARALGREYVRMSLGGVRDEAEIRGHRKTYVGAMPGRIIQNIKKVGTSNPVFILDEIDKVGADFRGDPSSALLEVLDPEQNSTFIDNYLEVEYDLSKVLFIATSNSLETIQPALRDRMEIIEITGYTLEEKVQIAKKHLVPKQRNEHGLNARQFNLNNAAIVKTIEGYTRESGVRELERKIGEIARNIAKSVAMEEDYPQKITDKDVRKILGTEIFDKEIYDENEIAGIVTGLAWTPFGGTILNIESSISRGKGKLILSGQLGDVMKESAMAAISYLKAHSGELGIDERLFDQFDLHIHVPAGAVPKDGPSAGITLLTSIASLFTQRRVKNKVAMTGEITLSGKVLPVGGIKEKILAAKRAGIREIIMCSRNKKDFEDINEDLIKGLKIHFVEQAKSVLDIALLKTKVKNPIDLTIREKDNVNG